eukprot:318093-Rhodomonas_salina.1
MLSLSQPRGRVRHNGRAAARMDTAHTANGHSTHSACATRSRRSEPAHQNASARAARKSAYTSDPRVGLVQLNAQCTFIELLLELRIPRVRHRHVCQRRPAASETPAASASAPARRAHVIPATISSSNIKYHAHTQLGGAHLSVPPPVAKNSSGLGSPNSVSEPKRPATCGICGDAP